MSHVATVWLVDDDQSIRWVLERALKSANIEFQSFTDGKQLLEALEQSQPNAIVSDIRMPNLNGLQMLEVIKQKHPQLPVIIMTAHSDLDSAVSAYQTGAFDYLPKPFDIDEAILLIQRALKHSNLHCAQPNTTSTNSSSHIIGEAPAMQEVFRAIGRLSQSNITVLINGQSGTGKELVAQALHHHSPRSSKAFIALNMAAIPKELLESELFGHEKGAFTGATTLRQGRFEQANGGTLFLDEIGDMPADTQTRLLRVLADGEFYRVGGHVPVKVDVRIIAATHQDLEKLVQINRFRDDLFHRLNVIRIHLPCLADRREDIPALTQHFLQKCAHELSTEVKHLTPAAMTFLQQLPWQGNVRQLENTCRWLTVMAAGQEVDINDLPPELRNLATQPALNTLTSDNSWQQALSHWAEHALSSGKQHLLKHALPEFERVMIEVALAHTQGRRGDAAEILGWGRNTLTRKISELALESKAD